MFERFTVQAREAVTRALQEARQLGHAHVGTGHLLLALLFEDAGIAYTVLHDAGLDQAQVRADVTRLVGTPRKVLGEEDAAALQAIGIDLDGVLARIEESFGPQALIASAPTPQRELLRRGQHTGSGLTPRAKKIIELSLREAIRLHHNYIGTEHILLGLLWDGDSLAAKILVEAGSTLDGLRTTTLAELGKAA
jgi:ATP-dependent Clp protease ATP-binding subunit ClpA